MIDASQGFLLVQMTNHMFSQFYLTCQVLNWTDLIKWHPLYFHQTANLRGSQTFFVLHPFPNIFKISATLKWYKLQQIKGNMTIQVDFGDPEETFGNPKKGRDPQFVSRWTILWFQTSTGTITSITNIIASRTHAHILNYKIINTK